ncbi:hypothetical protein Q8A64_16445 [Oxalobacteraceae bacterium R-40]|uniref:Uncharacterized protein n=1 Tax=Keguizhuia sedimenti TaxID=3064264 RepID=A0ABU1BU96_9BURK|nr:hypothetical protein [Oxalobacteraceae bacterium R-40]
MAQRVLVTAGASGIGKEIAWAFATTGGLRYGLGLSVFLPPWRNNYTSRCQ